MSSRDVWATGTFGLPQQQAPFTQHWNGSKWSIIPIKDPTAANNNVVFTGVKAISPTNVYAVGADQVFFPNGDVPRRFIEHWDGTSWKVVSNRDGVIPSGSTAPPPATSGSSAQVSGGFTEHFNGTAWSVVPNSLDRHQRCCRPVPDQRLDGGNK